MRAVVVALIGAGLTAGCSGGGARDEGPPVPPALLVHPADAAAVVGGSALFEVVATGTRLQYQWYRDGQPVAGANAPTHQLTGLTLAQSGARFHAIVSNELGTLTSSSAVLTVLAAGSPVAIVRHPVDATVTTGRPGTFGVAALGTGLTYQWRRGGQDIPGATGPSLAFTATLADHNATFDVRVSGGGDAVLSNTAQLRVNPAAVVTPVTTHPRLWVRAEDVSRFRGWATSTNPVYQDGLRAVALEARALMDNGTVPGSDDGGHTWSQYYTEVYAALFALMSHVDPDPVARQDWAARARTLLMTIMNSAVLGPGPGKWRSANFASYDRSRWVGHAFALAVDWIYPTLSAADKRTIRRVFLRWAAEIRDSYPTVLNGNTRPDLVPAGPARRNHPSLLNFEDPKRRAIRYGANNYFMSHARNMFLMAAAFDPADDVADPAIAGDFDGALRDWALEAIGTYLYVTDYVFRNDAFGGISPEGAQYGYSLGFYMGMMLAIHTSGWDDTATHGDKVSLLNHPFFDRTHHAFLHSLTPVKVATGDYGLVHQPPWFGDGQHVTLDDQVNLFGPMALYDQIVGTPNVARLEAVRWLQVDAPPGGPGGVLSRASQSASEGPMAAMLYFLMLDPNQPGNPAVGPAADPRPAEPLFFRSALGRMLSRTGWSADARLVTYKLSYNVIDHQHGDGNMFDFFRKGEWLTKEHTGYGIGAALSELKNTLTVQNDTSISVGANYRDALDRGSQFINGVHDGDPAVVAASDTPQYFHVTGDATRLYNFNNGGSTVARATTHVSRSLVWLKPDVIVVYDRAISTGTGRFKRFWLNLPGAPGAEPVLNGHEVRARTSGGQQLFVTTLRPVGPAANVSVVDTTGEIAALGNYWPATLEPMAVNANGTGGRMLRVEAAGQPQQADFLHVLEGADAGASPTAVSAVQSSEGTPYRGAVVGSRAVLFAVALGIPFTYTRFEVPSATTPVYVTGLVAGASYGATESSAAGARSITVQTGGPLTADAGGVLVVP